MKGLALYYLYTLTVFGRPALDVDVPNKVAGSEAKVLEGILNTVYAVAGIVAVVAIIIAGFIYVTSQGSPENVKKAKNAIVYATVGLIIVMMAFSITWFVSNRVS
jgi:heme/copper-type cytochrome/quinol oxidase subunit 2